MLNNVLAFKQFLIESIASDSEWWFGDLDLNEDITGSSLDFYADGVYNTFSASIL